MSTANAPRTPDRRQRKSRAALQQGLLHLISQKPYDAITIEDITAAADVARATFYAHYRDKTALLDEAVGELIAELAQRAQAVAPPEASAVFTGGAALAVFEHAAAHRDLYRLVLRGEAAGTARQRLIAAYEDGARAVFERVVAHPRRTPRLPMAATTKAFVGALLLTVEAWLDEDERPSAVDVSTNLLRAQAGGLEWSLGFAPGEVRIEPA